MRYESEVMGQVGPAMNPDRAGAGQTKFQKVKTLTTT